MTMPRGRLAAAALDPYILFAGGFGPNGVEATVDIFDVRDGSWDMAELSQARQYLAAATSGNQVNAGQL